MGDDLTDAEWLQFIKYKASYWATLPDSFRMSCSLLTYLGVSGEEMVRILTADEVPMRVRRVWGAISPANRKDAGIDA